jgi:flagellar motility protein MotE (MotC chaperone)
MDREKLVAAMQQEIKEIVALQSMLKNLQKAEERGYQESDQRRIDAIADLFAASNESLMSSYFKMKDEQDR